MTVCIAAISGYVRLPTIVAATDKMITVGDTGFDMPVGSKQFRLTETIMALIAGDSSDEDAIWRLAERRISAKKITGVQAAADCFAEAYRELRASAFEHDLLTPKGLTWETFNRNRAQLDHDFVSYVDRHVHENYLPISDRPFAGSTIIAGVDRESGTGLNPDGWITAHLYVVQDPGVVISHDLAGFVAIGSGSRHAEGYLMRDGFAKDRDFNHATLSVYSAKRWAEFNPNVGTGTELIRIDVSGIGYAVEEEIDGFGEIYKKNLDDQRQAGKDATEAMTGFMRERNARAAQTASNPEAAPEAIDGTADDAAGV